MIRFYFVAFTIHTMTGTEMFLKFKSDVMLSDVVPMRFFVCFFAVVVVVFYLTVSTVMYHKTCLDWVWIVSFEKNQSLCLILWYEHICCSCIHKLYSIFAKWMSIWPFQMNMYCLIIQVSHVSRRPRYYKYNYQVYNYCKNA